MEARQECARCSQDANLAMLEQERQHDVHADDLMRATSTAA
jgi:hypothetical protein